MHEYYVGLMSGTSMDCIDAALVDFSDGQIKLVACQSRAWPDHVHDEILASRQLPDADLGALDLLDVTAGEIFASAANGVISKAGLDADEVIAIGNHGQTIRHKPDGPAPFSLQIGDAWTIAKLTGIKVVSDFRSADINAGGEGAPLAPAFHNAVFRSTDEDRTIVNIGGITNLTILPSGSDQPVFGFDSGPGNTLMDEWMRIHHDKSFDENGAWAASGKIDDDLLNRLLKDAYFLKTAPKSTGFEYFNCRWLEPCLSDNLRKQDVQATLCELTARTIADAVKRYSRDSHILICGGGFHNQHLISRLRNHLPENNIESTEVLGVHPDWVEAMAFAWLARQTVNGEPGNLPTVTGARSAVVLGEITEVSG